MNSRTFVIAEIGINHNGSVEKALEMVRAAHTAGCDAVKFQKRTVDVVYSEAELARPRESPFGDTNGDLKRALELSVEEYGPIIEECDRLGLFFGASAWDVGALEEVEALEPGFHKISSPMLTDLELVRRAAETGRPLIISTGMSTLEEVDAALEVVDPEWTILLACTSAYPTADADANVRRVRSLRDRYRLPVGWSGHEADDLASLVAVSLGASVVERHFTLDRGWFGSDQKLSVEPGEMRCMVQRIRRVEQIRGDGEQRLLDVERPARDKLRRV